MKCPKCGEEMPEGSLYCEHCGEDIHIVPDFEPELEQNIQQNINSILEELHYEGEIRGEDEIHEGGTQEKRRKVRGRKAGRVKKWKVFLILGILVAAAAGVAGWMLYAYNSKDYLISRGRQYTAEERYDRAIACYGRALELDGNDIELTFRLAEVYFLKNNKIEYEYLLRGIARNPDATQEQLERACDRLIAIYRARGDYQTISDLLLASGNDSLMSAYQNYVARAPEFSVKEGYYTSIQPLKLTAYGAGKIYYTLDGSRPTEESAQYTAPIIMENGDYVVTACYVSDNGVFSDVVSKEYHIEIDEIPEPMVSVLSGEYHFPVNIVVSGEKGEIFYTTDGTEPTYSSTAYTAPIPMPLGNSYFRFAQIVNGVTGNVVDCTYQLTLNTNYSPEQAAADILNYSLRIGKISDEAGHFDDTEAVYRYEYQYVANINEVDDFYVIAEILRSADGSIARTGTNYAVNVYTGEYFKLEQDRRGRYTLVVLPTEEEEDSDEEE